MIKVYPHNSPSVYLSSIILSSHKIQKSHDYAKNRHFLNYAKAAFIYLKIEAIASETIISESLSKIYGNGTHIFCFSKNQINNFNINQYFHSFYCYGYHPHEKNKEVQIKIDYPNKNLILKEYSNQIVNIEYIKKLLNEIMPYTNDPLLEFFYQYQLIELLIDQVFTYKKKAIIEKLLDQNITASETRDRLSELQKILSEKERICLLAQDFTGFQKNEQKENLRQYCNDFLKKNKFAESDLINFHDYLYKLRNCLFHNHFKIMDYEGLEQINEFLRICLVDMIISYKENEVEV